MVLAVMPREAPLAAAMPFSLGYMGYRITAGRLMRDAGLNMRGGMPIICDAGLSEDRFDIQRFGGDTAAEMELRGSIGLVADFTKDTDLIRSIAAELMKAAVRCNVPLFVPEYLAETVPEACVIVPSTVTEGSLHNVLEAAAERHGKGHVALEIIPMRMDYTLPTEKNEGRRLTAEDVEKLIHDLEPMPFFSSELCAKYFTYIASDRKAHFVLYDDASTIVQKLRVAESCGVHAAFLLYAEVSEMLGEIRAALERE